MKFRVFLLTVLSLLPLATVSAQQKTEEKPKKGALAESVMEALDFTAADKGEHLLYRQYGPPEVEDGKKYPLLVFLHGYGERGTDNTKQLVHCADDMVRFLQETEPGFLIMPQCPPDMRWVRYIRPLKNPPHEMDRYPTMPLQMVERLIEEKKENLPIDPKRVYVAGLSMGGFGTWELISRRPDLFAAAIPICGGGDPKQVDALKKVAIWAFHGGADTVVPPQYSTAVIDALKDIEGAVAKYTEYPGIGHDSWTETMSNPDVLKWLFKQSKN